MPVPELANAYTGLESLLERGPELGPGFRFDIPTLGPADSPQLYDRLRFSNNGMIIVEPDQLPGFVSDDLKPNIVLQFTTVSPPIVLAWRHTDKMSTSARSWWWIVRPEGGMYLGGPAHMDEREHGPVTDESKRQHLGLALGNFTVPTVVPKPDLDV